MPIPPCEKRSNRRIISKNSSKYRDPKVGLTSSHGNFKGNSSKALHFLGTASREFPMEGKKQQRLGEVFGATSTMFPCCQGFWLVSP